ncbi:MAG: hypothetical protein ABIU05_22710 [Nitrospirales bacterium]
MVPLSSLIRFHEKGSSDVAHVQVSATRLSSQGMVIRIHRTGGVGTEVEDAVFDGATQVEVEVQTKQN